MAKYMVVNPKTVIDNEPVPEGTLLDLESVPPSLVGKVQEVVEVAEKQLEVATPKKRGE